MVRRDYLLGKILDIKSHLFGTHINCDISESVHLDRRRSLCNILCHRLTGEILRHECSRLSHGNGIAHLYKLLGIISVHEIRHRKVAL